MNRRQFCLRAASCVALAAVQGRETPPSETKATQYLSKVMDQTHSEYYVYKATDDAANHFAARGRMFTSPEDAALAPVMNENAIVDGCPGPTCIEATFLRRHGNHGAGWYFLVGTLTTCNQGIPCPSMGKSPAWVDLSGATHLRFSVKGTVAGPKVDFVAFGVGWNELNTQRLQPYADSALKISTTVRLTTEWQTFKIPLVLPNGSDLRRCVGGFGWWGSSLKNSAFDKVVFYIADIAFDKPRLEEPRFLVSFETLPAPRGDKGAADFQQVMRNAAQVYDNALAAIVYASRGDLRRARLIADALVYAQEYDRAYSDGRLRNVYQGGDLCLPQGWEPEGKKNTVRMSGWFDPTAQRGDEKGNWREDYYAVSTSVGNLCWAALALLAVYRQTGDTKYLDSTKRLGQWIINNCCGTSSGFTAGYDGWETCAAAKNECFGGGFRSYKATEHNIDAYVVFQRLYKITNEDQYAKAAAHALAFIKRMWDGSKFFTGTDDKDQTNRSVVPVDIQAWAVLALRDGAKPYHAGLTYAEQYHSVGGGFGFQENGKSKHGDKIWYEGTAHMALAYRVAGWDPKADAVLNFLRSKQLPSGAMLAASADGLETGFNVGRCLSSDEANNPNPKKDLPALYYRRPHVGATAWFALAESQVNPYWFGD
jgi:hypothetical protein